MRSKTVLAVVWLLSTTAAVTVVWQSLGFVTGTTASDGGLSAGPVTTAGADGAGTSADGDGASTTLSPGATVTTAGERTVTTSGGNGGIAPAPTGATTATTRPTTGSSTTRPTTGSPATAPTTAVPTTAPTTAAPATAAPAPAAVDQTFSTVGGTTAVRYANGGVTVLWATPAPGFTASIEPEHSGLKVEFRSDAHRSRVDVWWADGPRHDIREEPR